jgi:hypothetical protein
MNKQENTVGSITEALAMRKVPVSEAMRKVVAAEVAKAGKPLPKARFSESKDWEVSGTKLTFTAGEKVDHLDDRVADLAYVLRSMGTCPQYSEALGLHTPNHGRRAYALGVKRAAERAAKKSA